MSYNQTPFRPPTGPPPLGQPGHGGPTNPPLRELRPSEKIPPIGNLAPSMFVPLSDEFLDKHMQSIPRARVEMLQRILDSIEYQRAGVKQNLIALLEREKMRISLLAAEMQAADPKKPALSLDTREADAMIANMEAPASACWGPNLFPPGYKPDLQMSIHDRLIQDLLNLVQRLAEQLEGYDGHIDGVKRQFQDHLEKELMRINEAGLRPEERGQARFG